MKKYTLIFALAFLLPAFLGCCRDVYHVKNFDLYFNIQHEQSNEALLSSSWQIKSTDTLTLNQNYDSLHLFYEYIDFEFASLLNGFNQFNAYALTCDEKYVFDNPITQFNVVTLNNFSDDYPANSTINNLVVINLNNEYININNYQTAENQHQSNFYTFNEMVITSKPTSGSHHQFILKSTLQDGTQINDTTSVIVWQ